MPEAMSLSISMISELMLNVFLLSWWIVLIVIKVYQQPNRFSKVFREDGAGYTMFSAATTIVLFGLVYNNLIFGLNPEVLIQTKWATESKMCVAQLEALAKDLKRNGKSGNSKVHSLTSGWTWANSKKNSTGTSANRRLNETSVV
ncbi:hypothetical protein K7432_015873 [Basidiobolus ranarum]|uniref:Uncharacterized protein n=1 Tax=Basidiobolus ranarum TaxID=34480 RepID=A0ABR2WFJ2_9FUNG